MVVTPDAEHARYRFVVLLLIAGVTAICNSRLGRAWSEVVAVRGSVDAMTT